MKELLKKIINFIKKIIKAIILFLAWLFTPTKKKNTYIAPKKEIKKEEIKEEKKTQPKTTHPTEIPNEPITFTHLTVNDFDLVYNDNVLINNIYQVLERHYDIKFTNLNKEEIKIIKQYTEKYLPNIKRELPKEKIEDKNELQYKLKTIIEKQLDKEPLVKAYNEDVYFYTIKEKLVPTDKIKPEKADQKNKINKEDTVKKEAPKETNQEPQITVKDPKLELKDEIINALAVGTILLSNISKEIVTKAEEKNDNHIIKDDITIEELQQKIANQINQESNIKLQELTKDEQEITEDKKEVITPQEELKQEQQIEELQTHTETIEEYINNYQVTSLYMNNFTNQVERDYHKEKDKEEIEDRNYETIEKHIDNLINNIEDFLLLNEGKLKKSQIDALNKQKDKLTNLKEELVNQKNLEIEQEQLALEQNITNEEINGLRNEISKIDNDKKNDYQEYNLQKPEDLNTIMDPKQKALIEKKLIKKQLKKAANVIGITSILFFPFIRNKFYFLFTKNKLIQKHLFNINEVLKNRTNNPEDINEEKLINGESTLNEGYNLTNENIDSLEYIYHEAITKHPGLALDKDFNFEYQYLKSKLYATQKKLDRKTSFFKRFLPKYKGKVKKLIKSNGNPLLK